MDHKNRHDDKPRRDGLKQRLARILLQYSSCTTTTTTSAATFVTPSSSRREPPPAHSAAGPCCSHEPRPKVDRRRRGPIVDDCSDHGATTTSCARRSVLRSSAPMPAKGVVVREEMMSRGRRSANGDRPRSPSYRYSCSSSTLTDDDELAAFSSDGERRRGAEEAETRSTTLFSSRSRSLSSDSTSDFYTSTRRPRHYRRKPPRGAFLAPAVKQGKEANEAVGGVVGGMAVVKRSRNPYADFRSSMVEMVVERRIRGTDGMGELLVPYLCLNSPRHHPAILAAFEAVFDLQNSAGLTDR